MSATSAMGHEYGHCSDCILSPGDGKSLAELCSTILFTEKTATVLVIVPLVVIEEQFEQVGFMLFTVCAMHTNVCNAMCNVVQCTHVFHNIL
jgi:hypothetical protein